MLSLKCDQKNFVQPLANLLTVNQLLTILQIRPIIDIRSGCKCATISPNITPRKLEKPKDNHTETNAF